MPYGWLLVLLVVVLPLALCAAAAHDWRLAERQAEWDRENRGDQ